MAACHSTCPHCGGQCHGTEWHDGNYHKCASCGKHWIV